MRSKGFTSSWPTLAIGALGPCTRRNFASLRIYEAIKYFPMKPRLMSLLFRLKMKGYLYDLYKVNRIWNDRCFKNIILLHCQIVNVLFGVIMIEFAYFKCNVYRFGLNTNPSYRSKGSGCISCVLYIFLLTYEERLFLARLPLQYLIPSSTDFFLTQQTDIVFLF